MEAGSACGRSAKTGRQSSPQKSPRSIWRSGGAAFVPMMKSANFRERDHVPFRRHLHPSRRRRVFVQGEMCAGPMIIRDICGQEAAQVPLAEDDHMV